MFKMSGKTKQKVALYKYKLTPEQTGFALEFVVPAVGVAEHAVVAVISITQSSVMHSSSHYKWPHFNWLL